MDFQSLIWISFDNLKLTKQLPNSLNMFVFIWKYIKDEYVSSLIKVEFVSN